MGAVVHLAQQGSLSDRQLDIIKRTVASDTNPDEFNLFCEVARRTGLDPFRKQLSVIVFSKNDEAKRRAVIFAPIDGLRTIAARSRRYRPDEDEPQFVYDAALKDPDVNPLGIEKVRVRVYIRDEGGETWRPVIGVAYWSEFAPLKEEGSEGFEWVETGETWPDTGKPKKRKVPKGEVKPKLEQGNWTKMPRLMLAKCAEAQALRKAFPEDMGGLYEGAELDRARQEDMTASERIEAFSMDNRLQKAGIINTIMMAFSPAAGIEAVPIGQIADRVLEQLRDCDLRWLDWFESTNRPPLNEFWGRAKNDCLAVKRAMEARRAELVKAAQSDAVDTEVEDGDER